MSSRPLGISVLAVLLFLNVTAYAALAVLSLVNRDALASVLQGLSPGSAGPAEVHLSMGRFATVYYAAMVLVTAALAWGFWKLWNWMRVVALALIGTSLTGAAAEAFGLVRSGSGAASTASLARVAASVLISALVGWYLCSAKVRAAFRPSATGRESGLPNGSVHHA
jgi:hypothetical protein